MTEADSSLIQCCFYSNIHLLLTWRAGRKFSLLPRVYLGSVESLLSAMGELLTTFYADFFS